MNELAEENNYSTTPIAIKTRSKTSNSFQPISLSSVKDKQKPFNSKETAEQQLEGNIISKQSSTQTCPCQSKSKDKNSWICSSLCKQWWHSSCAAISAKDIKKYTTHSIYYICLYCNIQNIKNNKTLVENIINLLKTNTEDSSSPDSENPNPATAEESPGPTKRQKLPELDLIDFNNNNTSHCKDITKETAPINNINKEKLKVTEKRNQPNKINETHTVILDNISSNLQNSRDIKKHIYKILDSNIKIRYTYRLPKGGLVIDAQSQRDIEIISKKSQ